jgi:hypothetical protein
VSAHEEARYHVDYSSWEDIILRAQIRTSAIKLFDLPFAFLLSLKRRQETSTGMLDRMDLAGSVKINEGGPP